MTVGKRQHVCHEIIFAQRLEGQGLSLLVILEGIITAIESQGW